MRELCGTAAEYLGCRRLPDGLESGRQESWFGGGLLREFVSAALEPEQKHIYRPLA